jgi:ribosomal protein S27E
MVAVPKSETQINCAACGAQIAKNDTRNIGVYVAQDGAIYAHLLCNRCMARALASKVGQAEIAELVELRFTPSCGAA